MSWQSLTSNDDCQQLLNIFGGFHDGCLREMHLWTDNCVDNDLSMSVSANLDTQARLLFQRQFRDPSAIELLFHEIVELQISPTDENYDSIILDADLKHENGLYSFEVEGMIRVLARKLSWRDASRWMGSEHRYGPTKPNINH